MARKDLYSLLLSNRTELAVKSVYVMCICGVTQEVVDEMTSLKVDDVVRRRDGNTTSAVPAAFRRSDDTGA